MIKGIKIMLLPNNKQQTKLFQFAGAKRFAYNWALAKQIDNFKNGNKLLSDGVLRKEFTQLKKLDDYLWLNTISNNVMKQAIKDCCIAYKRFFQTQKRTGIKYTKETLQKCAKQNKKPSFYDINGHPKFKSKKNDNPKFYQDNIKIQFNKTYVKLECISNSKKKNRQQLNWIKLAEKDRIPYGKDVKYVNPRVSFDGIHWWISVGIEYSDNLDIPRNNGIGIDVGVKDLAICSDKRVYKNINKSTKVLKLKKKHKRLQRQVSRKYDNLKQDKVYKKGETPKKTNNIIKLEHRILKTQHKLNNIRNNYIHQTTSEIVKRKPSYITIEDLNIQGMMKNKHLAKAIQEQCLYEFSRQLKYKTWWNNTELRLVDRWYPSSKTCHECGYIKKDLKLSDRVYICPKCGYIENRDYNASLNLRDYNEYKVYRMVV